MRGSKPLDGVLVVDFSSFLAGPATSMKLHELGARVIKIEQPVVGDIARKKLVLGNQFYEGDSIPFHVFNRGKESYVANLKNSEDLKRVKEIIKKADVLIHNFRPGVMEKYELTYKDVKKINKKIIYGWVNGFTSFGKLKDRPGVDVLAQSISGLGKVSGSLKSKDTLFGLPVTDLYASSYLTIGILSLLFQRHNTKTGGLVETSLFEASIDLQADLIATHIHGGFDKLPKSKVDASVHSYLPAPAGIYKTQDGEITIAMYPVDKLFKILNLPNSKYKDPSSWWEERDEILLILKRTIKKYKTKEILELLDKEDVWCSPIYDIKDLLENGMLEDIKMIESTEETKVKFTRSPLRINNERIYENKRSPKLGRDNEKIDREIEKNG